jgi:hypothetical protein
MLICRVCFYYLLYIYIYRHTHTLVTIQYLIRLSFLFQVSIALLIFGSVYIYRHTHTLVTIQYLIRLSFLFQVSIALLIFGSVYMYFFLVETVERVDKRERDSTFLTKIINVTRKRYESMRYAAVVVFRRYLVLTLQTHPLILYCCFIFVFLSDVTFFRLLFFPVLH